MPPLLTRLFSLLVASLLCTAVHTQDHIPAMPLQATLPTDSASEGHLSMSAYPVDLQPPFKNLAFAHQRGVQVLYLFVPTGRGSFSLVVNSHGAVFKMDSKEKLDDLPIAQTVLSSGVAIARFKYRLSGEAAKTSKHERIHASTGNRPSDNQQLTA